MQVRRKSLTSAVAALGFLVATASALTPAARAADVAGSPVNLALAGTATASGVELGDLNRFGPQHLNDGDLATRWSSNYSDSAWSQIELAEPSAVDTVVIDWEAACAVRYQVQTSLDGTTWTTHQDVAETTCARDVIRIQQADPVRFVRMQGVQRLLPYGYSIHEMGIYAEPLPPAPELSPQDRIVPRPVSVSTGEGDPFTLTASTEIAAAGGARAVGDYLADILRPSTGFDLPVTDGPPDAGDIVLDLAPGNAPTGRSDEGYVLTSTAETVTVAADTPAGVFNGVQTLRQLLPAWIDSAATVHTEWTVPPVTVSDYPRFEYRGTMIDVARSFLTVEEIKRYIDALAQFKVNALHIHLTDDQAWRIAIENPENNPSGLDYTNLARLGGTGGSDVTGGGAPLNPESARRGAYSQADYREIVAYAASRFMTVVPEIDTPGHTNAALAAIPQLNPDGVAKPMNNTGNVGYSTLDADSEVTYEFLQTVFAQIAAMTPGPYLHIGGDEAHVTGHDNYLQFLDRAIPIVTALGKSTVGWTEYAAVDLPAGSVVQHWYGSLANTLRQVERGAKVIMSPAGSAYLDQKYSAATPIGLSWACAGSCDFDRYYSWNPAQGGLSEEDVLGVEGPLWSETVRGIDQAHFLTFPRMISLAEIGWTPQSARDLADFTQRLATLGGRLTLQEVNFHPSGRAPWTVELHTADHAFVGSGTVGGPIARFTAPAAPVGSVTATVDFGDGTGPVQAAVEQPTPGTNLQVNGVFAVSVPDHLYAQPGTYTGSVTIDTDAGRKVEPFTVTVTKPSGDDPTIETDTLRVRLGEPFDLKLAGFAPRSRVSIHLDRTGDTLASVQTDATGAAVVEVTIPAYARPGAHRFTASDGHAAATTRVIAGAQGGRP